MAGEKLIQKALGVLAKSAPSKVVSDPAERAANLARFMEPRHPDIPNVMYHGKSGEYVEGRAPNKFFLTSDPTFAKDFAIYAASRSVGEHPNIMPFHVRVKNPFDYDNPAHIDFIKNNARLSSMGPEKKNEFFGELSQGDWHAIEHPDVQRLIKPNFDSFFVREMNDDGNYLKNLGVYNPDKQLKSATGNAGTFDPEIPRLNEAHGGEVDAALHMLRQHRAEGGFLSGPDYLSTGEAASPTNWGDPELASDFFKADRAARLAREVLAQEPARDVPLPPRRPPPVSEEDVRAAPMLARASLRVKEEGPPVGFSAPSQPYRLDPTDTSPTPDYVKNYVLPEAAAARQDIPPQAMALMPSAKISMRAAPALPDEKVSMRAPSGPELTERDRDLIIRTIAAETSGKSPEESQAIAHVILNRIQSGKFGASPEAVLFAKRQFEPWANPKGANYPMRFAPTSARYGMGRTALEAALGGDDITRGALNFWGPKAQAALGRKPPKWAGEMPDYTDIGETRFHRPRAEGGEAEGYAGGGDVVAKALAALRGGNKVFPKPQRMFPEGARPPGGEYINAATGEAITGQKPARAVIGVTPEGKPVFLADPEQVDVTGSPGKGSTKTKTNLFKQQAGWKWIDAPEGYESVPTIVSAENRGQHYYGLGADFPKGVDLKRYADAPSEPRLRPTTQGNVYPGEQVGSIDVRGREHPVYDMLTIRNLLAGTGAAGAAAMPEGEDAEGYAGGGKAVSKALKAVSELFDSPGMTKWREKSVIPASRVEDRYYTGTSKDKDFPNFKVEGHGAWFTKDPAEASSYAQQNDSKGYKRDGWNMVPVNTADRVIPAYLRAENPFTGPLPESVMADNYKKAQTQWFDELRALGHDAWMPEDSPNLAVILKNPSDIKSALSNSGDFDLNSPRIDRAEGGEVEDALAVVRRHYATDGYVSSTKRLRDVIASIDPEAGQTAIRNQDVEIPGIYQKDPELAGRMWSNSVEAYRNKKEGDPEIRPLKLGARDVIGGAIAGGAREPGANFRRGAADLLVGSTGLPGSGTLGFGLADAPMLTGIPLTLADMAHDVGQGDYGTAAASAALPAALYARGPLGAAGRRAVEIAKEYAKPAAATAAGVAGATVAPDEAEAAKLSKLLRVVSPEDRLMMVHNLGSHRLADVEKLGGLPVPSTAVIKPEIGFDKFGDITMVAPKEMAHPSRTNPIFAADVYSPRFPSLNDEGTKIFRGFSPSGNRLYSPLTLENAVKEMKGNIRGGEGFSYGVGNIRAGAAPEFKSLEQIQNARDLIVPTEEVSKENAAKRFSELSEKFYPYYGYGGDAWTHEKDFADMMRLAGMGQWGELRKSYKSNIPPELHEEAKAFLDHLKTMPTEYFEGKPQRAVRLNEFRGAVVPGDIAGEQADILRRMGVERLEQYDPNSAASRIEALQKFEGEQFRYGGSIEDRALEISRKG